MPSSVCVLRESSVADSACKGLLFGVRTSVCLQILLSSKRPIANIANQSAFADAMCCSFVIIKLGLREEQPVTDVTNKAHQFMRFGNGTPGISSAIASLVTIEIQFMPHDVFLQMKKFHKLFSAYIATIFPAVDQMNIFFMRMQEVSVTKVFAALAAFKYPNTVTIFSVLVLARLIRKLSRAMLTVE